MASQRNLVRLHASLQEHRDELHRASALFESGMSHLDGSGYFQAPEYELKQRGLYLLELYYQEVNRILEELDVDIAKLEHPHKLTS